MYKRQVEEFVQGTAGTSNCKTLIESKKGQSWTLPRVRRGDPKDLPYEQEHLDLIASIKAGNPLNEAQAVAESTLTGIMGRESAYSGKVITWEEALNSKQDFTLEKYEFGDPLPLAPVAMPGTYEFV